MPGTSITFTFDLKCEDWEEADGNNDDIEGVNTLMAECSKDCGEPGIGGDGIRRG